MSKQEFKDISFIILLASWLGMFALFLTSTQQPQWNCSAEDEVVIIDNTCKHIEELGQ